MDPLSICVVVSPIDESVDLLPKSVDLVPWTVDSIVDSLASSEEDVPDDEGHLLSGCFCYECKCRDLVKPPAEFFILELLPPIQPLIDEYLARKKRRNMVLGAAETTMVTLTWALSLLLINRDVLAKPEAELDAVVGKERQVNEFDLKNLVYLQAAILKETLRMYPAVPIAGRRAISVCTVSGYNILLRHGSLLTYTRFRDIQKYGQTHQYFILKGS